jgi:Flp pilus assembly pilin Flp
MRKRIRKLLRKLKTRSGATVFEYALILFLVSIIAIIILQGIGGKTNNMVTSVNDAW